MSRLTQSLPVILISIILVNTLSMYGMEKIWSHFTWEEVQAARKQRKQIKKISKQATIFNQDNLLLVDDIFNQILLYCYAQDAVSEQALSFSIKNFMKLSAVCKQFNSLLTFEAIGALCKNYNQSDKDRVLKHLLGAMNDKTYQINRLPALILVCAGADGNIQNKFDLRLLSRAVDHSDEQLVETLFKYNVDPNIEYYGAFGPAFFYAKTIEIAQMFVNHKGFNVHVADCDDTNVLWYLASNNKPISAKLVKFYLAHNVDATKIRLDDNFCLLHVFAQQAISKKIKDIVSFLKKGKVLIKAMPGMINTFDKAGRTPIDVAQESLKEARRYSWDTPEAFEQLIVLFRKHGGFTAQELDLQATALQRQISQETEQRACIICLETQPTIIGVPCANVHPERMCVECYASLLATNDRCPICRKFLTK